MRRVFIVHGWGHTPRRDFFPWLKRELKKRGFDVHVPAMPNTNYPQINPWVNKLKEIVGKPRGDDIFVVHSVASQAVLRYLAEENETFKVGGIIMIAPWTRIILDGSWEDKSIETAKPWLRTPINWSKVLSRTKMITAILSDNDPFVPIGDAAIFSKNLKAKIIILHNKGHIWDEDGITELPVVLKEILSVNRALK